MKKLGPTKCFLASLSIFSIYANPPHEREFIGSLEKWMQVPQNLTQHLYEVAQPLPQNIESAELLRTNNLPLFAAYPELRSKLAYISLGSFPTPIRKLEGLLENQEAPVIYLKDDSIAGMRIDDNHHLFGGNKIRKLEFLLADALEKGASTVLTLGAFGSNHAACTATYAHELGLNCILLLIPQAPSKVVRRNLLLMNHYGATFKIFNSRPSRNRNLVEIFSEHKKTTGGYPYPIPVGGSNPLGILGFVNAAFELKNQIDEGLLPEPDKIYLPLGTGGSAIGLFIGIKALGLKTKIIAVATEPEDPEELEAELEKKFYATVNFLRDLDTNFPALPFDASFLEIRYNHAGSDYGLFTQESINACKLFQESQNINLENTYTAKAASCLIDEIGKSKEKDVILFWNTFSGDDFEALLKDEDYTSLPHVFHGYFQ